MGVILSSHTHQDAPRYYDMTLQYCFRLGDTLCTYGAVFEEACLEFLFSGDAPCEVVGGRNRNQINEYDYISESKWHHLSCLEPCICCRGAMRLAAHLYSPSTYSFTNAPASCSQHR